MFNRMPVKSIHKVREAGLKAGLPHFILSEDQEAVLSCFKMFFEVKNFKQTIQNSF